MKRVISRQQAKAEAQVGTLTPEKALSKLAQHEDPDVRACAVIIREQTIRRKKILGLVQDALAQLRLDMKYLIFDLDCTRRERDSLMKGE